ncbi:hypothetical protein BH11VER1_BH11VER1_20070 [soil metagenome]
MFSNLDILFRRIGDAEYAYLLLEPLPLFGLLFGLIFLFFSKSRRLALIVIAVSCASATPYMKLRETATPRILAMQEGQMTSRILAQNKLRKDVQWVYTSMTWAAVAAIFLGGRFGRLSNGILIAGAVAALLVSAWLHMKEAEVYHPNIIKQGPPKL